jgi:hypothetical protein
MVVFKERVLCTNGEPAYFFLKAVSFHRKVITRNRKNWLTVVVANSFAFSENAVVMFLLLNEKFTAHILMLFKGT